MFMMFNPQTTLFEPKSDFHKQILSHIDDVRRMFRDSDIHSEFMDSLTDEDREYVITLIHEPGPKGRRLVKRMGSINSKATDILSSEFIVDGSIAGEHTEGISRAV